MKAERGDFILRWGMLIVLLAVIALRQPEVLLAGRFWAEEATLYFATAWNEGLWPGIVQPLNGYYSLFVWIAVGLAAQAPLELAPLVTGYLALAVMMIPPLIILFAPLQAPLAAWRRCLIALVLVLPSVNTEVWLNSINAHFFFGLASALLLVCQLSNRRFFIAALALLFFAGLTGPLSIFLAPLYLLRALRAEDRRWWALTALLFICAALQSHAMISALFEGERALHQESFLLAKAASFLPRLLLVPFSLQETSWLTQAAALPALGASLAVLAALFHLARHSPETLGLWLLGSLLLVSALSYAGFYASAEASATALFDPLYGGRYFLIGNLLLGALLLLPYEGPWPRLALLRHVAAIFFLATSLLAYQDHKMPGYPWPQEVALWRADPSRPLKVWPSFPESGRAIWLLELDPRRD